jgi:hypothetical protein
MKSRLYRGLSVVAVLALVLAAVYGFGSTQAPPSQPGEASATEVPEVPSTSSPRASAEAKKVRWSYFQRMQRDPATGRIPNNIRSRELDYARTLPRADRRRFQSARAGGNTTTAPDFGWRHVGPNDVGGRTRALAIDEDDSQTILAGGVSGGIWKSTDGGANWTLKNTNDQRLSITSVTQDLTAEGNDTWYYVSGEFTGNSASDRGFQARFLGGGVYKSTDNGESWDLVADSGDITAFDSPFDYTSRVIVNPETGSVFLASNAIGVYRSTDGGENFGLVLGEINDHQWSEVVTASDGSLLAVLSSTGFNEVPTNAPGVYRSEDDGTTWTNVTPESFPDIHDRSVASFAPSNPDLAYVLTTTRQTRNDPLSPGEEREDVRLHYFDFSGESASSDDRSEYVPNFGGASGNFNTQGGYNMTVGVKPDDPEFVVIGGRNLWRSFDGFTSTIDPNTDWIGGYTKGNNSFALYPNQHPDQHAAVFNTETPDQLWSGNDGGLYLTDEASQSGTVSWTDKNNGYNVTQFYTVALSNGPEDPRVGGGAQDNGTPYFRYDNSEGSSQDISRADGSHLHFGDNFTYASTQGGRLLRLAYNANEDPTIFEGTITPSSASGQLFINPFVVDPNDETIMYYPAGAELWRNTNLPNATRTRGWSRLTGLPLISGCQITTLAISRDPAHRLYYGASCGSSQPPSLVRFDGANQGNGSAAQDISINALPAGAYVHSIAVNPNDADDILVAHSNYGITGLYYSDDGGESFTAVEGNLTGTEETPGPSLRSVRILPRGGATAYLVGTSTGLYSTGTLDGPETEWALQGSDTIGNVVVEHLDARREDRRVAVGTHGRGIFVGQAEAATRPATLASGGGLNADVQEESDTVLLSWQTAAEPNVDRYEIQIREPGSDEDQFETLAIVESTGPGSYSIEEELLPGTYEYRLRAITSQDAPFLFSQNGLATATIAVDGDFELADAYPNPLQPGQQATFSVSVAEAQSVNVELYDARGRQVRILRTGLSVDNGSTQSIRFGTGGLSSGVYFIRVMGEDFVDTAKMVVVR